MCGIAGALFWNSEAGRGGREASVARMVQALAHRGPDGEGVVRCVTAERAGSDAPTAILGHRRLSIIDLSDRASQPMASPRGLRSVTPLLRQPTAGRGAASAIPAGRRHFRLCKNGTLGTALCIIHPRFPC